MSSFTINGDTLNLTDEQFFQLCQDNRDLRFERNARGNLIIMTPAGDETSSRNASITAQLWFWNQEHKLGIVFDSSAGFILANGATRCPDAAWIPLEKWEKIPPNERERFSSICPDFVIELLSPRDSLKVTQAKMQEYIENGTILGWLINRKARQVEIYRQRKPLEILDNPQTLSGKDVLPGFILNLELIW